MRSVLQLALVAGVALAVSGCGLSGTWRIQSFEPPSAKGDFEFARLTFQNNNEFEADATYEGKARTLTGTYEYDKDKEVVTFKSANHPPRSYHLETCGSCGKLYVSNTGEPRRWTATFKRD